MTPLFKNRVFLIVAGADLLQQAGIWIRNMALLFYIMEQSGNDPVAVSLLTTLEYLPIFLFSLIGGTFADRWEPKKTVIAGDTLSAVSILLILLLVHAGLWQAVFVATVVSAIVSQFSQPSSSVLFRQHVPENQVGTAVGITQSMMAVFTILGPILGTFIYTQLGLYASLIALMLVFLAAAAIQLLLPGSSREARTEQTSPWEDLKDGLRYVWDSSNLRLTAALFLISGLSIGLTQPLDVFVAMQRLGLPKESVQWLTASEGIGMLAGGLLAAACAAWVGRYRREVMTGIMLIWAVLTFIEVLSVWPLLTAGARILSGLCTAFFQVIFSAFMIQEVRKEYIGRTNGVMIPVMMAGMLLGTAASGLLMNHFSLFTVYGLSALLILSCCILTLRLKLGRTGNAQAAVSMKDSLAPESELR
ncbi:MFS transporter [Paenibacillus sp. PK3_47]|uniref:MFS transporter n=1 Tax=Paenibacillus sp. PK3_47 TaxID=2072642 RepID=UPI00201E586C|nr:MFS transporter [Paenibacillus sp. PK3_47]UQZ36921.1 MFS transporter [Paenibacillus sp. PK3_47]